MIDRQAHKRSRRGRVMSTKRDRAREEPLLDRRLFLQLGSFGGLGLGLPRLLQAQAALEPRTARSRIKACILLFCYGGPSHLETWDPKPNAPREVRGEFRPAATSVPGLHIGEHLPRMARLMHKVALVRSMHHGMRNHDSACTQTLAGRAL